MANCENCDKELGTYEFNRSEFGIICDSCFSALNKNKEKDTPKTRRKWALYPKTKVGVVLSSLAIGLLLFFIFNYGLTIIMLIFAFILFVIFDVPMP